jgi:hypothetical protein
VRRRLILSLKLASIPAVGLAWISLAGSNGIPALQGSTNAAGPPPGEAPMGQVSLSAPPPSLTTWIGDAVSTLSAAVEPTWTSLAGGDRPSESFDTPPVPPSVAAGPPVVFLVDDDAVAPSAAAIASPGTGPIAAGAPADEDEDFGDLPLASFSSASFAAQFEDCRSGAQGGGYDAASGLWAWTCGNFNWHAAMDPTQATAVQTIDCTGLRTPDDACRRSGERLLIGVLHSAGVAADFTVPGGTVLWPLFPGRDHGIYVDRGAGLLADGTTRAKIPPAEQLDVRALIGEERYAATGPSARRHTIQALNVRHAGEVPGTFELDASGIPRRRGVWYVTDKGPHPDGNPTSGADVEDGPAQDIEPATAALMVGSQRSFSFFNDVNYCDDSSASDPRCQLTTSGDAFAGRVHWEYGAMSLLMSMSEGTGAYLCLSNLVGGDESSTTGTCPGDRRMRCWAPGATTMRGAGGCIWDIDSSGGVSAGDLDLSEGVGCQGFVDALEYDGEAKGRQLEVGVIFDNCVDDPESPADCSSEMGNHLRRTSIQDFVSGTCAPDARAIFAGTGRSQAFVPSGNLAEDVDGVETEVDLSSIGVLQPGQSIRVGDELLNIAAINANTLTVARGFSGTLAGAHASGSTVFASTTFNGTNTVWTPNYQVSGEEKVLAIAPAKLLQAPGGFENISLMPSDHRGSAFCAAGTEAACDGTIGIAFNTGSGFYLNGTILYPTFTANNASFFDGSNQSEQVLVEDLRLYGPTRSGTTFDVGDNWTVRRAIIEGGDPTSEVFVLSTFGDGITIEDSVFRNITSTVLLKVGLIGPQRRFVLRGNKFIANGGGGGEVLNIGTVSDFVIEGNEFVGNAGVVPIRLNPFRSIGGQTTKTYLRNGTIRNNLFSGNELLANGGEDNFAGDIRDAAKASIIIRDDESVSNDLNEISNLAIYDNTMLAMFGPPHGGGGVPHQDYPCLVWLEQDDEPVSRMEESWPNVQIFSNVLEAGIGGRVVCAGDTDPGYRNASASIDLFARPHRPVTWNNLVNGVAELSTRFLSSWNFVIDTPSAGSEFLVARADETVTPVSFDCVANGGTGLGYLEYGIEECDAGGSSCVPIGATAMLSATGTTVSDRIFTDQTIDRGDWVKVVAGTVAWTRPGTVSCSLGITR